MRKHVPLKDLGNMDEVPASFDIPGKRTVDVRGSQDISIATTGSEKLNFTIVLCVLADGRKLKPMVIFKRKTIPREKFPSGIIVKANAKGWMNECLIGEWVEEVWVQRQNPGPPEKSGLILDSAKCHLTPIAEAAVKTSAQMSVIPGGLTKKLQPLDLSVNKSFKNKLQTRWEQWMIDSMQHTYTKGGRMRHATYWEVCGLSKAGKK